MASTIKIFDFGLTPEEAKCGKAVELLISKLRPDWPRDKIRHKVITGGHINSTISFFTEDDRDDAVVLRINGNTLGAVSNRDCEAMSMQVAHHQGCFPEVLAFFKTGTAYKYALGRLLTIKEFENPVIARTVARLLCDFHNADIGQIPLVNMQGEPVMFDLTFNFYDEMRNIVKDARPLLGKADDRAALMKEIGMSRDVLMKEIDEVECLLEPLNLPKSITHFDYHQRNGVYDDDSGQLTILDLETSKMGYEAFDIGGLFVEGPWRRLIPTFYDESGGEPATYTEELKRLIAREYITRKYEIKGRDPSDVTDDVIQLQYLEHEVVEIAFHLYWMVCFVIVMNSEERDLPAHRFLEVEWRLYKKAKTHFPETRDKYVDQRKKVEYQEKTRN